MASEDFFYMDAQLKPEQARALLIEQIGFQPAVEPHAIYGHGLWIPITGPWPYGQRYFEERFGFTATLDLIFRVQSNDHATATRAMMRSVMVLLQHDPGDAILENNFVIALQRIQGKLLIDTAYQNPRSLELFLSGVTMPYGLCELPQPLMGSDE